MRDFRLSVEPIDHAVARRARPARIGARRIRRTAAVQHVEGLPVWALIGAQMHGHEPLPRRGPFGLSRSCLAPLLTQRHSRPARDLLADRRLPLCLDLPGASIRVRNGPAGRGLPESRLPLGLDLPVRAVQIRNGLGADWASGRRDHNGAGGRRGRKRSLPGALWRNGRLRLEGRPGLCARLRSRDLGRRGRYACWVRRAPARLTFIVIRVPDRLGRWPSWWQRNLHAGLIRLRAGNRRRVRQCGKSASGLLALRFSRCFGLVRV